jgi:hypothetical protein
MKSPFLVKCMSSKIPFRTVYARHHRKRDGRLSSSATTDNRHAEARDAKVDTCVNPAQIPAPAKNLSFLEVYPADSFFFCQCRYLPSESCCCLVYIIHTSKQNPHAPRRPIHVPGSQWRSDLHLRWQDLRSTQRGFAVR